jgi:hypothetical protein
VSVVLGTFLSFWVREPYKNRAVPAPVRPVRAQNGLRADMLRGARRTLRCQGQRVPLAGAGGPGFARRCERVPSDGAGPHRARRVCGRGWGVARENSANRVRKYGGSQDLRTL